MGKRKINKSNVTMEIGEETFPDRCTVVASYDLYMPGTKLAYPVNTLTHNM